MCSSFISHKKNCFLYVALTFILSPIFLNFKTLETLWCQLDASFVKNNGWQGSVPTLAPLTLNKNSLFFKEIILCLWVFYSSRYELLHMHAWYLQASEEDTKYSRIVVMNIRCPNVCWKLNLVSALEQQVFMLVSHLSSPDSCFINVWTRGLKYVASKLWIISYQLKENFKQKVCSL